MVTLRATRRVKGLAPLQLPRSDPAALAEPDTALGDWYVNALSHGRQRLLLLASPRRRAFFPEDHVLELLQERWGGPDA
jgi:hypothetical protein